MTREALCDVGVDTSDLPVFCNCGCSHCCSSTIKLSTSTNVDLKKARPLKLKQQSRTCSFSGAEKCIVQRNEPDKKTIVPSDNRIDARPGCTSITQTKKRKFSCALCHADFTRKHSLNIHLQKHASNNEEIVLRNTAKLFNHVIEEHRDESKKDQLLSSLARHESHEQPHSDKHKCSICRMSFSSHLELCEHSAVHNKQRSFCCAVCSASFMKKDSLNIHLRKHSGERPFECDICGATFSRKFILTNHRVLHSGEKNHTCVVCGKSFPTRCALTTHEKSSHSSSSHVTKRRLKDFTPSICDQCGKVYSNPANLLIHKRTHTGCRPFLCPLCGAGFGKKYSLQCHMRRHSDDRQFKCEECGAAFFRKSTLLAHQRRHSGEKPYRCKLCGRGFIQNSSLKYHIKHNDHSQASSHLDSQTSNIS